MAPPRDERPMIQVPKEEWEEMRDSVRDIKGALIGNPSLRQQGLIERVEKIEQWQMDVRLRLAGAATAISSAVALAWQLAKHLFDKSGPST